MASLGESGKLRTVDWVAAFGRSFACLATVFLVLTSTGCKDSQDQKARDEVVEMKSRVAKAEAALRTAKAELANVGEELAAAVEMRDALDLQVGKLKQERDEALDLARAAEQAILNLTERIKRTDAGKSQTQGQVGQLEGTIQQLQATIDGQQAIIAELEKTIEQQVQTAGNQAEMIEEQEVGTGDPEVEEPNEPTG